jgi:hypothetical protein
MVIGEIHGEGFLQLGALRGRTYWEQGGWRVRRSFVTDWQSERYQIGMPWSGVVLSGHHDRNGV